MKLRFIFLSTLVSCLLIISTWAQAAPASPLGMLQNASDQMLSELAQTKNRNTQALYTLIKRILLPHVDLDLMSEMVIGKYWASATPAQRAQFTTEFTKFVTRTYSGALSSYTNEKVRFFPIRGGISGNRVQVNSTINQANGENIAVSYRLIQSGGEWKIYDFSVEGASIVENYRSQFADTLRTQGLAGLLAKLHQQNAK